MSARRWPALLLAGLLTLSLAGCRGEEGADSPAPSAAASSLPLPSAPQEAVFSLGYAEGSSLHPLKAADQSNLDVGALVYEGLYELDETFAARPVLARSAAVSEDGLTWTIGIRTDAAFSSGEVLTAEHAAASLRAAKAGGAYAARLSGVVSVRAEEGAVVITLSAPNGNLPALLDVPVVLENGDELPLGTGPYAFDGDGQSMWLAANPNWWQGRKAPYDTIPLRSYGSLEDRVAFFDGGLVTAVNNDFSAANAPGYSGTYETHDYPTTVMLFVGFNTQRGACAKDLVRTALSRAFDRESIVSSLLSGHGDASPLPVSPASGEYSPAAAGLLDYDLDEAEALLTEAGYARNDEGMWARGRSVLTLELAVNQDSVAKRSIAESLADGLRKLGIEVTVSALDWAGYTAALAAGDFDLYLGEVKLTGDFDFTSLTSGPLNYGGYADQQVSGLLAVWRAASGEARGKAAEELFTAMADDLPFAPLCFKRSSLLVRWGMAENLAPVQGNPFAGVESWQTGNE